MPTPIPTIDDLRTIVQEGLGTVLRSAKRFEDGLCHYVYDAVLSDGRPVVLRLAAPENLHYLRGAVHWSKTLRPLGIPLPQMLHAQLAPARTPYPYLILERLPGTDLGNVYSQMSSAAKRTLAAKLSEYQHAVSQLLPGKGFGYQSDPSILPPFPTWSDVIDSKIKRTEHWLNEATFDIGHRLEFLRKAARGFRTYFDNIPPLPFLDDITTKNVLIDKGILSGIVDTDELCFGDRVAQLGLTRMALLARDLPTDYIDFWCDALKLNQPQVRALDFYTAEACLSFLGEHAQPFNREKPAIDSRYIRRLQTTFDEIAARLRD
jgi:hypothetical protein